MATVSFTYGQIDWLPFQPSLISVSLLAFRHYYTDYIAITAISASFFRRHFLHAAFVTPAYFRCRQRLAATAPASCFRYAFAIAATARCWLPADFSRRHAKIRATLRIVSI